MLEDMDFLSFAKKFGTKHGKKVLNKGISESKMHRQNLTKVSMVKH